MTTARYVPRGTPTDTGPIELRSYAESGRRLGTVADCYDGSRWELHRGELVEQMGSKDVHGILMALITALFRTHARAGATVMADVYCDLTDAQGPSLRAPDVVVVTDLRQGKDAPYAGVPVIAVEVRATQSKRYLEEKVALYLEHDWPCVWIVHAERGEVEVLRPGNAAVVYREGTRVPLPDALDKYGLDAVPLEALFDQERASAFLDGWVRAEGRLAEARASVRRVLTRRGLIIGRDDEARIEACVDHATLGRWLDEAITATTASDALR